MQLSEKEQRFVASLLDWYEVNGRHDLPWRQSNISSFQVLLAEFLLQSTRAEQVVEVFPRIIEQYPTPESIYESESALEDLETLIQPIGLIKRAQYITQSSGQIVEKYGSCMPRTRCELKELYGVGDYTANAVLAHSYGDDVASVDTNGARIFSRVFGLEPTSEPYVEEISELAHRLVPTREASDYNHALVDFGAAVCTHDEPACGDCPLNEICEYFAGQINHDDEPGQ